ncbi:carboxymuconolactone decarboxylase [Legionella santicrucis]|uniref:Carboxymuconolactone decarboxylase n=1 Tax=Legionella santicrucis TaxID=45074 RepID=A0A0W0Z3G8_9GAMM|nr:carboxymuconolactone decarboxylase family protein [Legionella santicrucis]KTD63660.1 carboxymuconolactone decarboxylase [Legionella santicrucis]
MNTPKHIPLPQDNELPPETVDLLNSLPPLNIHRLLTLAPNTHKPWLDFVAGIYKGNFDPRLREIAICRYGFKTNSAYELHQHKALARKAGISSEELEIICTEQKVVSLSNEENFICQVVDEFEDLATLTDETFTKLLERYSVALIMELFTILGHYSCVCRVLNASRIPLEAVSPLETCESPLKK